MGYESGSSSGGEATIVSRVYRGRKIYAIYPKEVEEGRKEKIGKTTAARHLRQGLIILRGVNDLFVADVFAKPEHKAELYIMQHRYRWNAEEGRWYPGESLRSIAESMQSIEEYRPHSDIGNVHLLYKKALGRIKKRRQSNVPEDKAVVLYRQPKLDTAYTHKHLSDSERTKIFRQTHPTAPESWNIGDVIRYLHWIEGKTPNEIRLYLGFGSKQSVIDNAEKYNVPLRGKSESLITSKSSQAARRNPDIIQKANRKREATYAARKAAGIGTTPEQIRRNTANNIARMLQRNKPYQDLYRRASENGLLEKLTLQLQTALNMRFGEVPASYKKIARAIGLTSIDNTDRVKALLESALEMLKKMLDQREE